MSYLNDLEFQRLKVELKKYEQGLTNGDSLEKSWPEIEKIAFEFYQRVFNESFGIDKVAQLFLFGSLAISSYQDKNRNGKPTLGKDEAEKLFNLKSAVRILFKYAYGNSPIPFKFWSHETDFKWNKARAYINHSEMPFYDWVKTWSPEDRARADKLDRELAENPEAAPYFHAYQDQHREGSGAN